MTAIIEKAKPIKLAIFDVDGVLTTGSLCYSKDGIEFKSFHVHDGLGIKLLQKTGITVAIITAQRSAVVTRRMQDLGIEHYYEGQEDKLPVYEALKQKLQLDDLDIAYMGDDLPDLPLLCRVGLAITVSHAPQIMQQHADWVASKKAGKGAVREACELIMQAQGTYDTVLQSYLKR